MKKISVIVPVYKAEDVLIKCVESILTQTYTNLEVILVDDGSPDHSGAICDQYVKKDSRVKVIHKKNGGVSSARNCGLDAATGDYCTFVDSDDYIDPIMYENMMKKAKQFDCDVVMCDCVKEYGDRSEVYTHEIRSGYYNRKQLEEEYFPHLLIMPNVEYPPTISNCLCLFKNENLKFRYEESIRFSEDLLFGAELIYHAQSFYYMKGCCFYHYWMNPQSVTHTFAIDKWDDYKKLHRKIENKFSNYMYYNFSQQIELVLLFFVYNAVSDILFTSQLNSQDKMMKCREVLCEKRVKEMFSRIKVIKLSIPFKLKVLTLMYKYRIGIRFLISKMSKG